MCKYAYGNGKRVCGLSSTFAYIEYGISIGEQVSDIASSKQLMRCIICIFSFVFIFFLPSSSSMLHRFGVCVCRIACNPSWQFAHAHLHAIRYILWAWKSRAIDLSFAVWVLVKQTAAETAFIQYSTIYPMRWARWMWQPEEKKRFNFDFVRMVKYWAFNKELMFMT